MTCTCWECLEGPSHRLTVSVQEAADLLGIGRSAAYSAIRLGQLSALKLGGRLRIARSELERFAVSKPHAPVDVEERHRPVQAHLEQVVRRARIVDWLVAQDPTLGVRPPEVDMPGTSADLSAIIGLLWEQLGPDVDLGEVLRVVQRQIREI